MRMFNNFTLNHEKTSCRYKNYENYISMPLGNENKGVKEWKLF